MLHFVRVITVLLFPLIFWGKVAFIGLTAADNLNSVSSDSVSTPSTTGTEEGKLSEEIDTPETVEGNSENVDVSKVTEEANLVSPNNKKEVIEEDNTMYEATENVEVEKDKKEKISIQEVPEDRFAESALDSIGKIEKKQKEEEREATIGLKDRECLAEDLRDLITTGELRVGMCTVDQPPFHSRGRNGEFIGFDVDLARNLAVALGLKLTIIEGDDWETLVNMAAKDDIDIIVSNLSLSPERSAKILCSVPYAKIRLCLLINRVLLARAGSEGLVTLEQILGKYSNNNLIIQEGTAFIAGATNLFPRAKIETTSVWKKIMDGILSRDFFGTISDEIEIKNQLKLLRAMELMPVILKGKQDLIVVGVSRKRPTLLNFTNAYLLSNNIQCNLED